MHGPLSFSPTQIRFLFDNGRGVVAVEYAPANSSALCDGNWHSVRVDKDGIVGTVVVDGTNIVTQRSLEVDYLAVNIADPLYVGGVPAGVLLHPSATAPAFRGCLASLQLTSDSGQVQTPLLSQAPVSAGATFDTCTL